MLDFWVLSKLVFWRFPNVFRGTQSPFRALKIYVFSCFGLLFCPFHNGMLDLGGLLKIVVLRSPIVFRGTVWYGKALYFVICIAGSSVFGVLAGSGV